MSNFKYSNCYEYLDDLDTELCICPLCGTEEYIELEVVSDYEQNRSFYKGEWEDDPGMCPVCGTQFE